MSGCLAPRLLRRYNTLRAQQRTLPHLLCCITFKPSATYSSVCLPQDARYHLFHVLVVKGQQGGSEVLQAALQVLDTHLVSRTFLVGQAVSLADIVLVCDLQGVLGKVKYLSSMVRITDTKPDLPENVYDVYARQILDPDAQTPEGSRKVVRSHIKDDSMVMRSKNDNSVNQMIALYIHRQPLRKRMGSIAISTDGIRRWQICPSARLCSSDISQLRPPTMPLWPAQAQAHIQPQICNRRRARPTLAAPQTMRPWSLPRLRSLLDQKRQNPKRQQRRKSHRPRKLVRQPPYPTAQIADKSCPQLCHAHCPL